MYYLFRGVYYLSFIFFLLFGWNWGVASFGIDQMMCLLLALVLLRFWPSGGFVFTVCWLGYLLLTRFQTAVTVLNWTLIGILALEIILLWKEEHCFVRTKTFLKNLRKTFSHKTE
ncbi:hypothetical protein ACVR1G_08105 [Streptococcus dentasini]